MKAVRSMILVIIAMVPFSGCILTLEDWARRENSLCETWIGLHKSDRIRQCGPPSSVVSDGQGGEILIYDLSYTTQSPGTAQIYPYLNTVTYHNPQAKLVEQYNQFFCDSRGVIYHWRWKAANGASGDHNSFARENETMPHRQNKRTSTPSKYEGDIVNGMRNGKGTLTNADGEKYTGMFVNDKRHGQGSCAWPNGDKYTGMWVDDKRTGQGSYSWPNGDKYTGMFTDDKLNGQGTATWINGDKYTGMWVDDKRHGQGTFTYADGRILKGRWINDAFVSD